MVAEGTKHRTMATSTTVLGWFLYSTRKMDVKALAEAIYNTTGLVLGLRWRTITLGLQSMFCCHGMVPINLDMDCSDLITGILVTGSKL